ARHLHAHQVEAHGLDRGRDQLGDTLCQHDSVRASKNLSLSPAAVAAIKKAGRWPTLFYGSIPSNLGIGAEYSHPQSKGKEISRNVLRTKRELSTRWPRPAYGTDRWHAAAANSKSPRRSRQPVSRSPRPTNRSALSTIRLPAAGRSSNRPRPPARARRHKPP